MFDQNLPMCDKILSAVGHDDQTDQIFKTVIHFIADDLYSN